jgi:hypothetical protein
MKLKTLVVVVVLLAVLSAAAFWCNRPAPGPAADPRVGQPLADPAALAAAAQVRLAGDGHEVVLVRQADGSWRDPGYYGLTADSTKLSGFIGDLTAAKIQRFVTSNPERISRLDFNGTKIELRDRDGHVLWAVQLGKSPDAGGRFVRFGDEAKAYLASLSSTIDTDPKSWADGTLLALKPEDIARISVSFSDGPSLLLARAKPADPWTAHPLPAGQKLSADKVSSLVNALGGLRFSDTTELQDPQVALAQAHRRTLEVTTFAGQTYRVALGRRPEEKPLPAKNDAKPAGAGPNAPGATPAPEPATTPAGPVYAFISSSDPKAPINALMAQRAFQVDDYLFTSLPQQPADLYEAPLPAAAAPASAP